jgi:hypothetical protein
MLLNDGKAYTVPDDFYQKLVEHYGDELVKQELNAMEIWLYSNPKNRKTKGGMTKFINSWLKRTKATGGVSPYAAKHKAAGSAEGSIRGRSINMSLTDITWCELEERDSQKQYFLTKYGFYYDGGEELKRA